MNLIEKYVMKIKIEKYDFILKMLIYNYIILINNYFCYKILIEKNIKKK